MQACRGSDMRVALSSLAHRAAGQLPRVMSSSRAMSTLVAAAQLPHRREQPGPSAHRTLATPSRAAAVQAPSATSSSAAAANAGRAATGSVPTFQEAIARLQEYWAGVGCALWLPHNTEVGTVAAAVGITGSMRG